MVNGLSTHGSLDDTIRKPVSVMTFRVFSGFFGALRQSSSTSTESRQAKNG